MKLACLCRESLRRLPGGHPMSMIERSSGVQTVITSLVEYKFHWMGDRWKQEVACAGSCAAIPRIWSVEGEVAQDGRLAWASPIFDKVDLEDAGPKIVHARLTGVAGKLRVAAAFSFEERESEVIVDAEIKAEGSGPGEVPMATYLIESSAGKLRKGESASITWTNPETTLTFEAEPPARVVADEAGQGTIRLKAIAPRDHPVESHSLRYRWRWTSRPGHQIWDREV